MPKYKYTKLRVMALDAKDFRVTELRAAVEYLKTIEQTKYTGLQATTDVMVGKYKLLAQPMIRLENILGKTPKEVWQMFDERTDEQIRSSDAAWNGKKTP